jgi:hypothetical protein
MREIKFRGQRTDSREWVYGYLYITKKSNPTNEDAHFILNGSGSFKVETESVGQFTGLKDKTDIYVYEGDIIKSRYTDLLYIICFEGRYVGNAVSSPPTHIHDISKITFNYYDVVGNTYDNPELLKKDA